MTSQAYNNVYRFIVTIVLLYYTVLFYCIVLFYSIVSSTNLKATPPNKLFCPVHSY